MKLPSTFMEKVTKTADCWHWAAAVQSSGYGSFGRGGRTYLAHRVAYEALVGPIPEGLTIDHLCFNKLCVNPAHMETVTVRENVIRGLAVRRSTADFPCGHPRSPENTLRKLRRDGSLRCLNCRECNRVGAARRRELVSA